MSTQANIGIIVEPENGIEMVQYTSLYYDGYPLSVLPRLAIYDSQELIFELISGGEIKEIDEFDYDGSETGAPSYFNDKGEVPILLKAPMKDYLNLKLSAGTRSEYNYLFNPQKDAWICACYVNGEDIYETRILSEEEMDTILKESTYVYKGDKANLLDIEDNDSWVDLWASEFG